MTPLTPHIDNVEEFLSHCHRRRYPAKTLIIYAGDKADTLYYIIKGSVAVVIEQEDTSKEIILAYLNAGDFVGEMGLFEETKTQRLDSHQNRMRSRRNQLFKIY